MKTLLCVFVLTALLLATASMAAVPTTIDFQGFIQNSNGQPFTGENVILSTSLFNDITGGQAVWTEADTLDFVDGLYTTRLGDIVPLTLQIFQDPTLFLEVSVNGNLSGPRTQLVSVPFALVAELATHAVYADSAGNSGGGSGHWVQNGEDIANTNSGRVLIGGPCPSGKLFVQGVTGNTGDINDVVNLRGAYSLLFRETAPRDWTIMNSGSSSKSYLRFKSMDTGGQDVTFESGNVGIGTPTPDTNVRLSVAGGGSNWAARFTNGYSDVRLAYPNGSGLWANTTGSEVGGLLDLNSNSISRFLVLSNGKVGINNNSPTDALDVNGNIRARGGQIYGINGIQGIGSVTSGWYSDNSNLAARIPGSGSAYFGVQDNGATTTFLKVDRTGTTVYGDLCVTGQKNRVVDTPFGRTKLNAVESAEAWFEKSGEGHLTLGRARINLSEHFQSTVTVSSTYPLQVNVTFYGQHGNWYVERDLTGFTIIDPEGGNAEFSWTVKARQQGYERTDLELDSDQAGR